jgi:hypothetical protein
MRNYFGFTQPPVEEITNWNKWLNSTSRRVLVLRNPVDRWKSAEVFMDKGWFNHIGPKSGMDRDTFLRIHREPFLINIPRDISFEIIPFENLSDYLPWGIGTLATNSSGVDMSEVEMTKAMREELLQYRYFRENYKVISPEEWKELTP